MATPWTLNFLRRLTYVTRGEPAPKPRSKDPWEDYRALNDLVHRRIDADGNPRGLAMARVGFAYDDLGRPTEEV